MSELRFIPVQSAGSGGGPPFPVTAANNGLSVDIITGKIVLGGDLATPSVLLSDRWIDNDVFSIFLKSSALLPTDPFTQMSAGSLIVGENTVTNNSVNMQANTSGATVLLSTQGDVNPPQLILNNVTAPGGSSTTLQLSNAGAAELLQNTQRFLSINRALGGQVILGDIDNLNDGSLIQIEPGAGTIELKNTTNDVKVLINGAVGMPGQVLAINGNVGVEGLDAAGYAFAIGGVQTGAVYGFGFDSFLNSATGVVGFQNGVITSLQTTAAGDAVFFGAFTTGDPGLGAAAWKLGSVQASAVALDATRYVEVSIAGVVVKLAVVV